MEMYTAPGRSLDFAVRLRGAVFPWAMFCVQSGRNKVDTLNKLVTHLCTDYRQGIEPLRLMHPSSRKLWHSSAHRRPEPPNIANGVDVS